MPSKETVFKKLTSHWTASRTSSTPNCSRTRMSTNLTANALTPFALTFAMHLSSLNCWVDRFESKSCSKCALNTAPYFPKINFTSLKITVGSLVWEKAHSGISWDVDDLTVSQFLEILLFFAKLLNFKRYFC
jgi:hypothetical protein